MNKKAETKVIVDAAMVLVFAVVFLGAVFMIAIHLKEAADYTVCEESFVANYAVAKLSRSNFEPPFNLLCYTQTITIDKDGIYQESLRTAKHKVVDFEDGDSIRTIRGIIGKEVVEEDYLCRKQFAFGAYAIFSKWEGGIIFNEEDEKKRCFKCAEYKATKEFWDMWNEKASSEPAHQNILVAVSNPAAFGLDTIPGTDKTYQQEMKSGSWDKYEDDFVKGKTYESIFQTTFNTGATGALLGSISGNTWYYQTDFIVIEDKNEPNYCGGMV